jgi:hypothetical protein
LDNFLFAAIGEERNGMLLTVVSALGRLGLDPWTEADRFAGMPKTAAAQMLAPMIARLPEGLWAPAEAQAIATRLVNLLPKHRAAGASDPAVAGARKPASTALWLVFAVLLTVVLVSMVTGHDLSSVRLLESSSATSSGTD